MVDFIVRMLETVQVMPEDYVIKQGQKATCMYFLAQGQCEVIVKDHTKKEIFVEDLKQG